MSRSTRPRRRAATACASGIRRDSPEPKPLERCLRLLRRSPTPYMSLGSPEAKLFCACFRGLPLSAIGHEAGTGRRRPRADGFGPRSRPLRQESAERTGLLFESEGSGQALGRRPQQNRSLGSASQQAMSLHAATIFLEVRDLRYEDMWARVEEAYGRCPAAEDFLLEILHIWTDAGMIKGEWSCSLGQAA